MSTTDATVFVTEYQDGSADFTISIADEDHQFSVSPDGSTGLLSYEETLSWRGEIRVSEPDEEVWAAIMQSDEMTDYLESHDLDGVRRENL